MIDETIYDNQITATKCYGCIHFPLCMAQKGGVNLGLASENDCMYFQPKMPDDVVVLTKEKYEVKQRAIEYWKERAKMWRQAAHEIRKETAREILIEIYKLLLSIKRQDYEDSVPYYSESVEEFDDKLYELAKQNGVEVE